MATAKTTTTKAPAAKPAKAEKPTDIFTALIAAQAAIKNVGKNGTNNFDKYKYRGIDDVMDAVHAAFVEAGVIAIPEVLEREQVERTSRKGELMIHTTLTVRYTFYAPDGSSVSATVQGEGLDRGDKSLNKAMSAAYKYCAFQVMSIPTAEMIDSETESPEIGKAEPPKQPAKPQAPAPQPDPKAPITREAAKKLAALIAEINKTDQAWWSDTCTLYGIAKTTEILQGDYNRIVQAAQARLDELNKKEGVAW